MAERFVLSFTTAGTPALDHAGVHAAILTRQAHTQLAETEPSVTYAMLAEARQTTIDAARQLVSRLRRRNRMITLSTEATTLIPSFQFDTNYDPIPEVGEAIQALTRQGMDEWAIWHWFTAVNPWIEERPVDLIEQGRLHEVVRLSIERASAISPG